MERIPWIDAARGVGISLVVWGHMWRGIAQAGIIPQDDLFHRLDQLVYSFHMPLFFILSGLFMQFALRPEPVWRGIAGRCLRLLYPLALWFYLFEGLRVAAGSSVNSPITLDALAVFPFPGRSHFWFLWALFCLHVLSLLAVRLLAPRMKPEAIWQLLFVVSLAGSAALVFLKVPAVIFEWLGNAIRYAPYFFFGAAFAPRIRSISPGAGTAILAGIVFLGLMPVAGGPWLGWPLGMLLAFAMSGSVLVLCAFADRPGQQTAATGILEELGNRSLPIYVSHTIFSAGCRISLLEIGVTQPAMHIVLGVLAGLAGPVLLFHAARRLGMLKVLGFA